MPRHGCANSLEFHTRACDALAAEATLRRGRSGPAGGGMVVGMAFGMMVGSVFDRLGLGMALGMLLGIALGDLIGRRRADDAMH